MFTIHNCDDFHTLPEKVFKKYYSRLCDFACYLLKDQDAAEDIVQDVFIVYLEEHERISPHPDAVKSFLYSSVKNACLNKIRHLKVVDGYHKKFPLDILDDPQTLNGIIHAEVLSEIHEAINALPEGCALVLKYGYLEGLQNRKIAELLNISLNTVKSQKQRALQLLRLKLSDTAFTTLITLMSVI
ncbi:RNA polymerase sigma-70 factor [Pedobacter frigoris]|uniref:RNA polymerase sigma-70 factor n=1 Tax=Pedobacter frigoris TaxID=2571272 RepID=A0A4U1CU39_9SPHI|nr:RNA polymerase sigma-70 factor [Pedobacter frigoris]TKC09509.1 RNA polymerase sigma-70 factor [Pedobacter frigoris]